MPVRSGATDATSTAAGSTADAPTETSTGTQTSEPPADANTPAELPDNGTASGADNKPKRIALNDMRDEFGPIEIPDSKGDDGKPVTYTLTRDWTEVAGAHVEYVRDLAEHCHVKLRSSAVPQS
ncbi:hypothetical protein [Microcystis phage Mwe-JY05]